MRQKRGHGKRFVIAIAVAALLLGPSGDPDPAGERIQFAQLVIHERIIVRVPTHVAPPPAAMRWKEKSAPNCVTMTGIAGAALRSPDTVDFILTGGARYRAKLENSCPALDFYSGFYILPPPDGKMCAGRDTIHARSGGECQIKKFRKLVPVNAPSP
jgi:hypothetical protein